MLQATFIEFKEIMKYNKWLATGYKISKWTVGKIIFL
jgi:hypothetical protein